MPPLNRREALKATTALLGGAWLAACDRAPRGATGDTAATAAAAAPPAGRVLSADDQALIEEIADTLLPTTPSSPGAKAAGAGAAINLLLSDCYDAEAQRRVVRGLGDVRARAATFAALPRPDRERLLRAIDAEAQQAGETHDFHLVRQLAVRAYFSSEVGMTKALRYVLVPGRWTGCVPLQPGQPAWG